MQAMSLQEGCCAAKWRSAAHSRPTPSAHSVPFPNSSMMHSDLRSHSQLQLDLPRRLSAPEYADITRAMPVKLNRYHGMPTTAACNMAAAEAGAWWEAKRHLLLTWGMPGQCMAETMPDISMKRPWASATALT